MSGDRVSTGQKIRDMREEKGLTQDQLADLSDIAQPNIARLESGKHEPRGKTLRQIAKALGCDLSDLRECDEETTLF